jgi:hypothetical protein
MITKTLLLILTTLFALTSFSQDTIKLSKSYLDPTSDRYKVVTDRPPQSVFLELGGPALILSANYDRRFEKRTDGFGFRAGFSTFKVEDLGVGIFTFGINHLVGNNKKGRFFESGINYTLATAKNAETGGFSSLTIGYRNQPVQGGFCFRAGLNPIFIENTIFPWPYLSFGYNF